MAKKTVTIPTGPEELEKIQKSWDDYFRENPPAPLPDYLTEYISIMREEKDFYYLLCGTWIVEEENKKKLTGEVSYRPSPEGRFLFQNHHSGKIRTIILFLHLQS
ncbi:hypothetical protein [Salinimicrobium sp. WS361]|uniref:hypothetical protein n=1 Tax=Salinimicrobium sp. WS361 TaxID=3425123 RepID=UPI003D6E5D0B